MVALIANQLLVTSKLRLIYSFCGEEPSVRHVDVGIKKLSLGRKPIIGLKVAAEDVEHSRNFLYRNFLDMPARRLPDSLRRLIRGLARLSIP